MPTQDTTPPTEIAALAAELAQEGIDPSIVPTLQAELTELAQAWDAAAARVARRQRVQELADRGPAAIERRFGSLFLSDGSQWYDDGRAITMEFPPDRYNTPELRALIADRLEARDHGEAGADGDHGAAGAAVVAPKPDDDPPPPASIALSVGEARSEVLGLRGLWSYQGTAGDLQDLIAAERAA